MKNYRAIFFDWDGTAVTSRKAPVDQAVSAMKPLLAKGIDLAIVSGTTMENLADGKLADCFTSQELDHLYLGLGRGAYNYRFSEGTPVVFSGSLPDQEQLRRIHTAAFWIHMELKERYQLDTDIVFSRPNYCKIDLSVSNDRGENLYMQEKELEILRKRLRDHGLFHGIHDLVALAGEAGSRQGIRLKSTCDAKYLEVGLSDKADNTNELFSAIQRESDILPQDCAFFGDEFVSLEGDLYGSDSCMMTPKTKGADFFDVSDLPGGRPEGVRHLGGGVAQFLEILREQGEGR